MVHLIRPGALDRDTIWRDRQARWDKKHLHHWQCHLSDYQHMVLKEFCRRNRVTPYRLVKHLLQEVVEYEVHEHITEALMESEGGRRIIRYIVGGNQREPHDPPITDGGNAGRDRLAIGGGS